MLYFSGQMECFEEERIERNYNYSDKQDYEIRNVQLARAVIDLEKEVMHLKRAMGDQTLVPGKNKNDANKKCRV
jgi:hypothetical protein